MHIVSSDSRFWIFPKINEASNIKKKSKYHLGKKTLCNNDARGFGVVFFFLLGEYMESNSLKQLIRSPYREADLGQSHKDQLGQKETSPLSKIIIYWPISEGGRLVWENKSKFCCSSTCQYFKLLLYFRVFCFYVPVTGAVIPSDDRPVSRLTSSTFLTALWRMIHINPMSD